jgi:hypothetical protein
LLLGVSRECSINVEEQLFELKDALRLSRDTCAAPKFSFELVVRFLNFLYAPRERMAFKRERTHIICVWPCRGSNRWSVFEVWIVNIIVHNKEHTMLNKLRLVRAEAVQ